MRSLFRRCTIHHVIEGSVYPYRCSRCGQCFVCGHRLTPSLFWVCRDRHPVSAQPSSGWPTDQPLPLPWWRRFLSF